VQHFALTEIHQQQTIVIVVRKIPKHETRLSEDSAVDFAGTLQPKPGIFPTQFQKIDMQIVNLAILFAL